MNTYSYSKPPKTPTVKRAAVTPVRTAAKVRRMVTTPVRRTTPGRVAIGTPDRFIPNRARTDVAKARHSLLKQVSKDNGSSEYCDNLRKALFGKPEDDNQILNFGTTSSSTSTVTPKISNRVRFEDPYCQDTLRNNRANPMKGPSPCRKRKIQQVLSLDAPGMLGDTDLSLFSCGPALAVALVDRLYLWYEGHIEALETRPDCKISSVQWSTCGKFLALGLKQSVQIWWNSKMILEHHHKDGFEDYVTAIAWKDNSRGVLSANEFGILRYDLTQGCDYATRSYEGHGRQSITGLIWTNNQIISCGGGSIHIYDANQAVGNDGDGKIAPSITIQHPGVSTIRIHPMQHSVLVSGGDDGLRFWNLGDGSLRNFLQTEARVSRFEFSPLENKDECVVAIKDKLSVYILGSGRARKVAETTMEADAGHVLSMDCMPDGRVICSHEGECITGFKLFRENQRPLSIIGLSSQSPYKMPVIR